MVREEKRSRSGSQAVLIQPLDGSSWPLKTSDVSFQVWTIGPMSVSRGYW